MGMVGVGGGVGPPVGGGVGRVGGLEEAGRAPIAVTERTAKEVTTDKTFVNINF